MTAFHTPMPAYKCAIQLHMKHVRPSEVREHMGMIAMRRVLSLKTGQTLKSKGDCMTSELAGTPIASKELR